MEEIVALSYMTNMNVVFRKLMWLLLTEAAAHCDTRTTNHKRESKRNLQVTVRERSGLATLSSRVSHCLELHVS